MTIAKFLDHEAHFRPIVLPAARNSSFHSLPGGSGVFGIKTGGDIDSHDAINTPKAPPSTHPIGAPVLLFIYIYTNVVRDCFVYIHMYIYNIVKEYVVTLTRLS